MKVDYKNWVPKGMIVLFGILSMLLLVLFIVFLIFIKNIAGQVLAGISGAGFIFFVAVTVKLLQLHTAFSYKNKKQLPRRIIEGIAKYVTLPENGTGLDVGCGSGALTIACAKRNPQGKITGVDRWGKDYASFSNLLCVRNAEAEGVTNVEFVKGDANKLPFEDETFDIVTSNYVYHNIKMKNRQDLLLETLRTLKKGGSFAIHDVMPKHLYGDIQLFCKKLMDMGYEDVRLIDTTNGIFMSPKEAKSYMLTGSKLLVGRK